MGVKKSSTRFAGLGVERPCATRDLRGLWEVIRLTAQGSEQEFPDLARWILYL